ncbi:hypothetical protein BT69DRAFT_1350455 [Atractiella rhizophila]|nr:hypothetical protein BT69DRAFT_1350455 [Atractiella rhizophila]
MPVTSLKRKASTVSNGQKGKKAREEDSDDSMNGVSDASEGEESVSDVEEKPKKGGLKRKASKILKTVTGKGKGKKKDVEEEGSGGEEEEEEEKPKKKAKKAKAPVQPLDPSIPHNTSLPDPLVLKKREEGRIRVVSWNVAGLNASLKKGFKSYISAEDPDILFISETRLSSELTFEKETEERYPHKYFGFDPKKGNAGVLFLSKIEPTKVVKGLPTWTTPSETEGRIITLEFPTCYLIGTYTPNAGAGLKTLPFKEKWNEAFLAYLLDLDKTGKPIVWMGDINCARTAIDIRNAKTNWNKSAGYTEQECQGLEKQLKLEGNTMGRLVDTWREKEGNKEREGVYTYYAYKFQCRSKGIGWRLDGVYVSESFMARVKDAEIRSEVWGASDHLPVLIDVEGKL